MSNVEAISRPAPKVELQGAHVNGMAAYEALVAEAAADYARYWARLAREFVTWKNPSRARSTTAMHPSPPPPRTLRTMA